jgi:outer membrane protein TolC
MRPTSWRTNTSRAILAIAIVAGFALGADAQNPPVAATASGSTPGRPLSLADALRIAEEESETVGIARAGVTRARGEQYRARSQLFPQLNGIARYGRTLASEFDVLSEGGTAPDPGAPAVPPGPCDQYIRDPSATTAERLQGLEDATRCATGGSPFGDLGDLPFGQENQYTLGIDINQTLFSGGRVAAANRIARAGRRAADVELAAALAQLRLDVTEAYFDAALSDRLLQIAESSLVQTENVFRLTKLSRQVGDKSEFDLLRAQVTRDNQRPLVIARRTERDLAYLRLKQLLDLDYQQPITLAADLLSGDPGATLMPLPEGMLPEPDTTATARATARQAAEAVEVQEGILRIQRAQRLPSVSVFSQYGRVAYPRGGVPGWSDFRDNWSVGVELSLPLFTGGRIRGDELVAEADLDESKLQLQQVTEFAALDARSAIFELSEAEAAWEASAGTAEQAARAYSIAEVRYREGISTQVELSESRILLQEAQANRAQAARDLQVARVRLALLRDLPLAGAGGVGQGAAAAAQQLQQQLQQMQQGQQGGRAPRVQNAGTSTTSGRIVP